MNRKILTLVCLILAATPGLAFSASVYKWTDENGVVHFGDRQPTGQPSEKINIRSGKAYKDTTQSSYPQQLPGEEQEQQEQAVSERRKAQLEAIRKQREANCAMARANLDILNNSTRIRVEEDGEPRYLSPEEIEAEREKFQRIAKENCEAGPAIQGSQLK